MLVRIFYADRDEEAAKLDGVRQASILMPGYMCTYCVRLELVDWFGEACFAPSEWLKAGARQSPEHRWFLNQAVQYLVTNQHELFGLAN